MPTYRLYADNTVVHEDDFEEYDNATPYYDDYEVHTVPEGTEDIHFWDINEHIKQHIMENMSCNGLT